MKLFQLVVFKLFQVVMIVLVISVLFLMMLLLKLNRMELWFVLKRVVKNMKMSLWIGKLFVNSQSRVAEAAHQLKIRENIIVIPLVPPPCAVTMSKGPSKADLIEAIESLGETPPSSWTMVELKSRLSELKEENGIPSNSRRVRSDLQEWTIKLNKAATKNANLQAFCQKDLGLSISGAETIDQLKRASLEKIYMITSPHPSDGVGFGAHASLTYDEIKLAQPEYCQWVKTSAAEGGCNYRLTRLARWLEMEPAISAKKMMPKVTPRKGKSRTGRSHSPSAANSMSSQAMAMMTKMVHTIEGLKEEVEHLKEGKPHKKSTGGVTTPREDAL